MNICDSCYAKKKVVGGPFKTITPYLIKLEQRNLPNNATTEELHLCLDCAKTFTAMAASLRGLIEKYGVGDVARHLYAEVKQDNSTTTNL